MEAHNVLTLDQKIAMVGIIASIVVGLAAWLIKSEWVYSLINKCWGATIGIEKSDVKLKVTAVLSLVSAETRHGLLVITALNTGKKVARIRRVAVTMKNLPLTMGEIKETPVSSELNISQKQAVVQIQGDDDIHEWQQVLRTKPNFEAHHRESTATVSDSSWFDGCKKCRFE